MELTVFLSGEIHSDWRRTIREGAEKKGLPLHFLAPVTDHDASDNVGVNILGEESDNFWKDRKAAGINNIRIRRGIERADVVVVKFGEQYKQWNAAFDAGFAAALDKPLIVLHPEAFNHALKEIDAQAVAVAREEQQVVDILEYVALKE